jgi:hypothetical protein
MVFFLAAVESARRVLFYNKEGSRCDKVECPADCTYRPIYNLEDEIKKQQEFRRITSIPAAG